MGGELRRRALLAARVYSIELDPVLADAAAARLARLGYANVETRVGDGRAGWPDHAPYHAIVVAAVQVNAVGAGRVLQHCRKAKGALVASAGTVYSPHNDDVYRPFVEGDAIGQSHAPWAPTSPASKVSLEAVARFCAEGFSLPTTIVRINVVYGPLGGMPVDDMALIAADKPVMTFADPYPASPIHADDMCQQVEALLVVVVLPKRIQVLFGTVPEAGSVVGVVGLV